MQLSTAEPPHCLCIDRPYKLEIQKKGLKSTQPDGTKIQATV